MNSTILDLLRQGLVMTALGMGLVFAGLGLLWALMALLTRLLTERAVAEAPAALPATVAPGPTPAASADAIPAALALTAERQQVAAIIAGALLANALPIHFPAPAGPALEHGRVSTSWVSANRSHALQSWQPLRPREPESRFDSYN